jgi:hypothetical protein
MAQLAGVPRRFRRKQIPHCARNGQFFEGDGIRGSFALRMTPTLKVLSLVPEGLARFKGELNSFLGLLFSAERLEAFSL